MPPVWWQLVSDWLMQTVVRTRDWRMGEVRSHLVPGGVCVCVCSYHLEFSLGAVWKRWRRGKTRHILPIICQLSRAPPTCVSVPETRLHVWTGTFSWDPGRGGVSLEQKQKYSVASPPTGVRFSPWPRWAPILAWSRWSLLSPDPL